MLKDVLLQLLILHVFLIVTFHCIFPPWAASTRSGWWACLFAHLYPAFQHELNRL